MICMCQLHLLYIHYTCEWVGGGGMGVHHHIWQALQNDCAKKIIMPPSPLLYVNMKYWIWIYVTINKIWFFFRHIFGCSFFSHRQHNWTFLCVSPQSGFFLHTRTQICMLIICLHTHTLITTYNLTYKYKCLILCQFFVSFFFICFIKSQSKVHRIMCACGGILFVCISVYLLNIMNKYACA